MNTRNPKRQRLPATSTNVNWKAQHSGNVYPVILSPPEEGDTCNIMHEEIATASLDWVCPAIDYFVRANPKARKAKLPCGHIFYVTAIAYHFRKNGMRCPVCRQGEDNPMNAQAIPKHLRATIIQRADETNSQEIMEERQETEESNRQVIQRIIQEELVDVIMAYRPRIPMHNFRSASFTLTTMTYSPVSGYPEDFDTDAEFVFPLRCIPGQSLEFVVPRSQLRNFSRYLQGIPPITMSLAVKCNDDIVCITHPINIPMFGGHGQLNNVATHTPMAVFTPDITEEITTLSTPTFHFPSQIGLPGIFRGRLILQLSQFESRTNASFPIEGVKWVPDITELTHVMLQGMI